MKKIFPSSQYKKDFKRYRHQPHKLAALGLVIDILAKDQPIPPEYSPHTLHGKYDRCMECHIQGDLLLIWFDPSSDIIELVRLGSHAELFK